MGPVSNIVIEFEIDEELKQDFYSFIQVLGGEICGNDIFYKGRSFLFGFGWSYPEEIVEYNHLQSAALFTAKAKIHLSANCNKQDDHRYLAELGYAVCCRYKGVVEFCDDFKDRTDDVQLLSHPQHYSNGETSQFGQELMKMWLHHNDFHMVK
ncbi:DUF6368 family protein [Marinobacter xestospongiae]|uniref:DUF6368 family protein n=1 Tax=Marinobacter xestospongiae TaxID=994319 RepID=A0ABU3VUS8_9GAMM|nr:DUF6368 family protein [Marinobacter xestospongiae]MDV2078022.1 DUF6368 family protein [Marinobacter xestospongiae]